MVYNSYLSMYNASSGLQTIFLYTNYLTGGALSILILFMIFSIVMFGSYFSKERLSGHGDFPASFAVASYATTGIAFLFSLIPGMINITVLVICIALSIIGTMFLLLSKDS